MRLCYVGDLLSIHMCRWARFFAQHGHQVHVISPNLPPEGDLDGVTVHRVPKPRGPTSALDPLAIALLGPAWVWRYRRIMAVVRPDVVHAHNLNDAALFGLLTGRRPFVATAWGSDVLIAPQHSWVARKAVSHVLRRADLITSDAHHMKEALVRLGADPEKVAIVFFGTDVERFHPGQRDPQLRQQLGLGDSVAVISLRRLEPIWDVRTLIEAAALVLPHNPSVRFVVAGGGSQADALQRKARSLGLGDSVRFVGHLSEGEVPRYLASADICVSTALSDGGLSGCTAEAMACGLPVVITDNADNRQWVQDDVSGYLFPPGDAEALAARILDLAGRGAEREQVGLRARQVIALRNNWKDQMLRMEALYQEVLERAHARRR